MSLSFRFVRSHIYFTSRLTSRQHIRSEKLIIIRCKRKSARRRNWDSISTFQIGASAEKSSLLFHSDRNEELYYYPITCDSEYAEVM